MLEIARALILAVDADEQRHPHLTYDIYIIIIIIIMVSQDMVQMMQGIICLSDMEISLVWMK